MNDGMQIAKQSEGKMAVVWWGKLNIQVTGAILAILYLIQSIVINCSSLALQKRISQFPVGRVPLYRTH